MNIAFIGNCQMASLCFYFQQLLLDCNVKFAVYGDEFLPHLGDWSNKVVNKIINYDESIEWIKTCDIVMYQEISKDKSVFSNTEVLIAIKKESCKLIKLPSIPLDYDNYDISINELKRRENENKVDIIVSDIFEKYREARLVRVIVHPNTFMFLEIVNKICKLLNIDTFSELKRGIFLSDDNYMNLP